MTVQPGTHPSADILRAFGLGKLDETMSGMVMFHLEQCEDCRKEVVALTNDDFLVRLRLAKGRDATAARAVSSPIAPALGASLVTSPRRCSCSSIIATISS